MDEAIRLAQFMAGARTVPKHLWDSPGDCLMVIELAMRWGMSPFAVAQATSIIQGKQMIEGKLVAAAVENSGAIVGHIDYDFAGVGDARSITVTATRRGETNPRTVEVKLADAKTSNPLWVKQPDQQLVYHGARVWARRWTPAVILGVYSREEMGPVIDGTAETLPEAPQPPSSPRDALNAQIPLKPTRRAGTWRSAEGEDADRAEAAEKERAAAATMPRGESVQDTTVYDTADDPADDGVCPKCQGTGRYMKTDKPCFACNGTGNTAKKPIVTGKDTAPAPERTREAWVMWINGLIQACDKQTSREGIEAIAARPSVEKALAEAPPWAKDEIDAIIGDFMAKLPALPPADDLDEVVIAGEEKLAAG
jgi:hypothetical protein